MISIEKKGRPTVSFTSRHFVKDAQTTAEVLGLPEVPLAIVNETITNQAPDRIRSMIAGTVEQVEEGLTRPVQAGGPGQSRRSEREVVEGEDQIECFEQFNSLFVERGWSDGLPLVPPTPRLVDRMLAGTRLSPETVIVNGLYPGLGVATVEKIAINGVMAGCHPEHMPALIALMRAYEGLGFLGKTQAMSTGPNAPLILISGPVIQRLGFNNSTCVAGPGSPSHVNTVVGRALRLMMMNIGQAYPGVMDMDTIGTPNKFSFCLAENAERSPWTPWNVDKGFDKDTSTLSITMVYPGPDVCDFTATNSEEMLNTLSTLTGNYIGVASIGRWLYGGWQDPDTKKLHRERNVLLLAPSHAALMERDGWSREDVQNYLYEKSRIPFGTLYSNGVRPKEAGLKAAHPELMWLLDQPDTKIAITDGPDCFEVFVTGGDAGRSQFYYGGSELSTVAIEL